MSPGSPQPGRAAPGAGGGPSPLVLPDPPLRDAAAGVVLRPWALDHGDVTALAAAWADPVLVAANGVPADVSAAGAARWICGDARRRSGGTCLDLVIGPVDGARTVLGEVGLRNIDLARRRAEISWWVAAEHRRRGRAVAAVRLLVGWALSAPGGLDQVWARIDPSNTASARVADRAGLVVLGPADGTVVWSVSRAALRPTPS